MSEYQYYEFQALDRPLTAQEMKELRSYSTRARITPTSFVNDYAWGSFKGDVGVWMEKYFDAFLYAGWPAQGGTPDFFGPCRRTGARDRRPKLYQTGA